MLISAPLLLGECQSQCGPHPPLQFIYTYSSIVPPSDTGSIDSEGFRELNLALAFVKRP